MEQENVKPLTKKQHNVLTFIKDYHSQQGVTPTRQEIADHFGYKSPNAAQEYLNSLHRKGVIEIIKGASRGIKLLGSHVKQLPSGDQTPLIGQVAAGVPIVDEPRTNEFVQVAPTFFSPAAHYFLEVKGDSMKDIGLLDGDLVAIHQSNTAFNGQVVVARCDNELTIKRYYQSGKKVTLKAENEAYEDINIDLLSNTFSIDGVMVGSIRRMRNEI